MSKRCPVFLGQLVTTGLALGAVGGMAGEVAATTQVAPPALSSPRPNPEPPRTGLLADVAEDALPVAVSLNGAPLGDGITLWSGKDFQRVPLGELCGLLEVPCLVDTNLGTAVGGLVGSPFRLDLHTHQLLVSGVLVSFPEDAVAVRDGDLQVSLAFLAKVLPVEAIFIPEDNRLKLEARSPMPVQTRLARESQRVRRLVDQEARYKGFVRPLDPYAAWDIPAVDLDVASAVNGGSRSISSAVSVAGDFLWATGLAALRKAPGAPAKITGLLSRSEPEGGLLGGLNAKDVRVGDVAAQNFGQAVHGGYGPGFSVSNSLLDLSGRRDRWDLRGRLPNNWQVELYLNDLLVGFQTSNPAETYSFLGLPLVLGENTLKLVFHGPGGETREEFTHINSMEQRPKPGEVWYHASGTRGITDDALRYGAGVSYGVTRSLEADGLVAMSLWPGAGGWARYAEAGLSYLGSKTMLGASVTERLDQPERVLRGTYQQNFAGGQSLAFDETIYQAGFQADGAPLTVMGGLMTAQSRLFYSGVYPSLAHPWGNYGLGAARVTWADGRQSTNLLVQTSATVGAMALVEEIRSNRMVSAPMLGAGSLTTTTMTATSTGNYRGTNWSLMGDVAIRTGGKFDGSALSLTYRFPTITAMATVGRDAIGVTTFKFNLSQLVDTYQFNLQYAWTRTQWSATVGFHVGLTRDPASRRWTPTSGQATTSGATAVSAYLDTNGNHVHDPDEKALPSPQAFASGGKANPGGEDSDHWFGIGLGSYRYSYVGLQEESLEDPSMRPAIPGYRIVPRPGHTTRLDFPVVMVGDASGTVCLSGKNGALVPIPGIEMELVAENGVVVATTRSGFDGFFDFEEIKPGKYSLRVAAATIKNRGLTGGGARQLLVSPLGGSFTGQDFVLLAPSGGQ